MTESQDLKEKLVSSLTLTDGICLPTTATVLDAMQAITQSIHTPFIAIKDDQQQFLGLAPIGALISATLKFDSSMTLRNISLRTDMAVETDDYISLALARLGKEVAVAVIENGRFKGLLLASEILRFVETDTSAAATRSSAVYYREAIQFASYVAHDLGSPLTVMLMCTEMLEHSLQANEAATKYAKAISRGARQAQQICNGLVQLERYAIAKKIFSKQISLKHLMNEIYTENMELVALKGHSLLLSDIMDQDIGIDPYLIKRSIVNLIDNACIHSPTKGQILLSAKCIAARSHKIDEFSVHDEGRTNKNYPDRIFDPFVRLENKKTTDGYGLGLAIVKQFTELHGGSVRVERNDAPGTKFVISLPLNTDQMSS